MNSTYWVAGALTVAVFAGCGGDDKANVIVDDPPNRGGSKSTGVGGKSSGGPSTDGGTPDGGTPDGGTPDGGTDARDDGPLVKILSPVEAQSPEDGVLAGQTIRVLCKASPASGGTPVDASSVTVSLTDAAGEIVQQKASTTAKADEYQADLVVATSQAGRVTLACAAKDRDGAASTDTIKAFLDRGPTISVISPEPDSAHPLKGGLDVTFTVDPVELTASDPGAEVGKVTFSLDGKECVVGNDKCLVKEVSPGRYHAVFALDDTDAFPVTPAGAITITAANQRQPEPIVASTSYNISVDGTGPVIAIESPAPQAVVGGKVRLVFTVTDVGSGVDPKSVYVKLYPDPKAPQQFYGPDKGDWSRSGDKYTFIFDTKELEKKVEAQTTINVLASDLVGNPSANGQSLQLYLDNIPPSIDLDPRNVRMRSGQSCSNSFDPVGPGALSDLDGQVGTPIVNPIAYFRVFVDEAASSQTGQTLLYPAGTDQKQVRLYLQADPDNAATKLLVNKNPAVDNTCDDIGGIDKLVDAPPFTGLKPISTTSSVGTVWNQVDGAVSPEVSDGLCNLTAGSKPLNLCPGNSSDMWYVPYNAPIKEPFVYVVGTPNSGDKSCAGIDLAFLTADQKDGWVCAAARVVDNAGNVGISPPLRVCVDDGKGEPPPCRVMSITPPTCTDGCTPPPRGGGFIRSTQ